MSKVADSSGSTIMTDDNSPGSLKKSQNSEFPNSPTMSDSGVNSPTVSDSGANSPTVSDSGANSPTVSDSGANSPTVSDSGANSPTVSDSGANSPTVCDSGANSPTMSDSGINSPTVTDSGANSTGSPKMTRDDGDLRSLEVQGNSTCSSSSQVSGNGFKLPKLSGDGKSNGSRKIKDKNHGSKSNQNDKLCDLMVQLKLKNPYLGRKEMLLAIQEEGPKWKGLDFEQVKRKWKKMMKQTSTDKETKEHNEALGQGTYSYRNGGHGASNDVMSSEEQKREKFGFKPKAQTLSRSAPLEKQLKAINESHANYILFTPSFEPADYAIQLAHPIGGVFFRMLWNRAINAPFGSIGVKRELWMIYDMLEFNLPPRYKKLLRKQLQAEFGADPFEGKASSGGSDNFREEDVAAAMSDLFY